MRYVPEGDDPFSMKSHWDWSTVRAYLHFIDASGIHLKSPLDAVFTGKMFLYYQETHVLYPILDKEIF